MDPFPPVVEKPIFFLDYDGTLAPIVAHPREALPHPDVPSILTALERSHPVWIVTGRAIGSLSRLLSVPLPAIGVHGLEKGQVGGGVELLIDPSLRTVLASAKESLPALEGVWVEEKGPTFAVHFRGAADQTRAEEALHSWAIRASGEIDVMWGKKVLELRPRGYSKGHAVVDVLSKYGGCTAVYVGDDTTDEDAFRMLAEPAVTIKVGSGKSAARYRVPDVDSVVAYLRTYL